MTWYSNSSYIVAEVGILNATVFSGTLVALYNAGQLIDGFTVGRISKFTKSYSIIFGFIIGIIAFFLTWMLGNKAALVVAAFLAGYADAFQYSTAFAICGHFASGRENGLAVGLMNAAIQGGCFFGPYILMYIAASMNGNYMIQMKIITVIALVNLVMYAVVLKTEHCQPVRDSFSELPEYR